MYALKHNAEYDNHNAVNYYHIAPAPPVNMLPNALFPSLKISFGVFGHGVVLNDVFFEQPRE